MTPLIYLNNATTSHPRSPVALAAFDQTIREVPRDLRHFNHQEASLPQARARLARRLAQAPEQVFFCPDATTALNAVIRGWLRPQDHALVDNRPHNAITRSLHHHGSPWSLSELYDLSEQPDYDTFLNALRPNTRLLCLTHASNVSGAIYDVPTLIRLLRLRCPQAAILVDAAQSAGVVDLRPLRDADFLVFSGHKALHALPGAAVLVARQRLRPILFGGTGEHSDSLDFHEPRPHFVEVGTPNLPAIMALVAAYEDFDDERERLQATLQLRVERLYEGLTHCGGLRPLPPQAGSPRTGVIACECTVGHPEQDWIPFLRVHGIIARGGLQCAPVQHQQWGLPQGSLRFSVSRYTTDDELDRCIAVLRSFDRHWRDSATAQREAPSTADEAPLPPTEVAGTVEAKTERQERVPIQLLLGESAPCAELRDAIQVEGRFLNADIGQLKRSAEALGWSTRYLTSRQSLFARRTPEHLYIDAQGVFSLSRCASATRAQGLLEALLEGMRLAG
ncbi:MAG: aminotransferase class V-fold PLP-dependent enzyme [Myxococcota bacterium]|jgi:selenocysteine lyase/cysteine desulfurase|nr:aminotransferase class V-fold PLP-dependent enzyme [Myxococcota bacterium]